MDNLKSLQLLWLHLAQNQRYATLLEAADMATFVRRCDNEGLPFLTSALPSFGKALDSSYSTNKYEPPEGFESSGGPLLEGLKRKSPFLEVTALPIFLGKAVSMALAGDPLAVDFIRQMSYIFYKLEVKFNEEVESQFLDQFVNTDRELGQLFAFALGLEMKVSMPEHEGGSCGFTIGALLREMRGIIGRVLSNEDPFMITPSHGSGATACRTSNSDKYHKFRYFKKLDDSFSYDEHFFFSPTHLLDEYEKLEMSPLGVPRARVCLVPKDSRGPRVISCEPAELMYIQQGIMMKLYRIIEHHPLTAGFVNFTNQDVNRSLAEQASLGQADLATLDLKDASDRVSLELVRRVFPPNWVQAFEACRSVETELPDGRVVELNKFAPMGSACCFPVEALVFWACAEAARRMSWLKGKEALVTYVYGDDIITSTALVPWVVASLELIGLKVNVNKCYARGPFRESCGGDYYLGRDVTPVRLRKPLDVQGSHLNTTADFLNNIIRKFGYSESSRLISFVETLVKFQFPRTLLELPGSLRTGPSASNDVFFKRRWKKDFQRFEHRVPCVASKVKQRHPPNWGELLRKQLHKKNDQVPGRYGHPIAIEDAKCDPGYYADPHSVVHKWDWVWLG
jgi:hypothetical protein